MLRTSRLIAIANVIASAPLAAVAAQTTAAPPAHVVIVQLVTRNDPSVPFAFEPSVVQVQRGDTVRFAEAANTVHNVRFVKQPPGAKLGAAAVGPFLSKVGDTYSLVIDSRFADGKYEYVCDPHQMLGMKGIVVVSERQVVEGTK
jgi:plastocyanin